MKKIIILFILCSSPLLTGATQGTCSYHGGVNCSIGMDSDGSAICNDGWRDSTESYYSVISCKNVIENKCIYPSYSYGCATNEDLNTLTQRINGIRTITGLPASPLDQSQQNEINECNKQIKSHKESMTFYKTCMLEYYNYNVETRQIEPPITTPQKSLKQIEEDKNIKIDESIKQYITEAIAKNNLLKEKNRICQELFGLANYSDILNKCECVKPTILHEGKCTFEIKEEPKTDGLTLEELQNMGAKPVKKTAGFRILSPTSTIQSQEQKTPTPNIKTLKKDKIETNTPQIDLSKYKLPQVQPQEQKTLIPTSTPQEVEITIKKETNKLTSFIKKLFSKIKFW